MAQLLTLRLTRNDSSTSWGFRLQGGKDFGTPLLIQKVNVGSLAERAGLQVGDAVIRVNGKEVSDVRHKDAQDVIVRAGNVVEFQIQRGGTATWKPSVTPVGSVPSPNPFISTSPSPITKTSLAASPHQSPRIPQGFNSSSKPFSPQQTNGGYVNENGSIKAIVNKQYNTPVGIYSDESIAETLSAQAEVLAGGVLGVNFKKNEKNYNAENSEVFKMVLEAEKEPKSPEPERPSSTSYFASHSHAVGGQATSSRPQTPIADLLNRPRSTTSSPIPPAPKASSDPDGLSCLECRQNIVGVFVRIKEKNLHVECFKCATCGTSLKNVGYYSINNKLYCDIHAKMVARQNPPAPNLEPITVSPSQHGASKIISTALIANSNSAPLSPQPTLAPVPFHPPRQSPTHVSSPVPHSQPFSAVNGSKSYSPSSTFSSPISAPKPGYFQSQKAMPFSKVAVDTYKPSPVYSSETQHVSYYNPSQKRLPFLKPRAEKASAFMPVMKSSHSKPAPCESTAGHVDQCKLSTVFESIDQDDPQATACHRKKLSICSQEVKSVFSKHFACSPAPSDRPESPVPSESADEFQHYETPKNKPLEVIQSRPHSVRSISPYERPTTPSQVVVFPPQMPDYYHPRISSPLPIYSKPHQQSDVQVNEPFSKNETEKSSLSSPLPICPNPKPRQLPDVEVGEPFSRNEKLEESDDDVRTCVVDQIREIMEPDSGSKCIIEKTRETLTITCMSPVPATQPSKHEFEPVQEDNVTLESLPRPATPSGYIASLLTTASDRPFTPIEPAKATIFTEPVPLPPETIPYFPTSKEENHHLSDVQRPVSPMTFALTIASERSYSPLPTIVKFEDLFPPGAEPTPEEEPKRPSLANALTVAPKRSYTPLSRGITEQIKEEETDIKVPDLTEDPSIILTRPSFDIKKSEKDAKKSTATKSICLGSSLAPSPFHVTEAAFPPICDELKAKFEKRLRTGSISDKNVPKTFSSESVKEASAEKRPARSPFTPTGLYKPINLPHYQQCVKELTSRNKTPLSRRNTPTPKGPESRKNTPTPRSELSRKNTPTPKGDACRKSTPIGFEATVSTQVKIFHPEPAAGSLKTSALSFLTQTKDITEKIPPVLGYQPGSIVENMSSYTKVEKCVRTVCEKTLKQIQATGLSVQSCTSQSNEQQVTKTNTSRCSSPINTPSVSISAVKEDHSAVKPPRSSTPIRKTSRPSTPVSQSNQHQSHSHPSTQTPQPKQTTFSPQQHVFTSTEVSQQQSTKLSSSSHPSTQTSQSKTTDLPQQHVFTSTEVSQQKSNTTSVHSHSSTQTSQPKTTSLPQQRVFTSTEASQQQFNTTASSSQQRLYSSSSQTKSMAALNISHNLSKTLTAIASKHQSFNTSSKNLTTSTNTSSDPNLTGSNVGVGSRAGTSAGLSAPRRGRGVWNPQNSTPGARIPLCAQCSSQIRGPFITALGKIWCPEHFICVNKTCRRSLLDIGFVEEPSGLHCEYCFEKYLAPSCGKCSHKIKGDCLNAIGKHFHPECFVCAYCNKLFGNSPFFLEEGLPYCENDWNELFTTKCFACGFPIEAGDRWVEALNNNYHSPCFNCTSCKTNLEGQSFYAKGGRPFCKSHAR